MELSATLFPHPWMRLALGASDADLVISSGGVSVGEEDHIKQAVQELGELDLWKVAMRPGKPLAFGRIGDTPFFGAPGQSGFAVRGFLSVCPADLASYARCVGRPCSPHL